MSFVKYRVKEVAADFGVTPKDIAEIVGKYFEKPRSNTQVLTDEQLNVVFDVITQKHHIASLEQVFAVAPQAKKPEPKKAEAPKPAAQPAQKQLLPALTCQDCCGYRCPRRSCHTGHRPHEAQRQRRMRQQKRTRRQQQHTASHTAAKGSQQHSSRCFSARRSGRLAPIFSSHKKRPLAQSTLCKGACVLCLLTS